MNRGTPGLSASRPISRSASSPVSTTRARSDAGNRALRWRRLFSKDFFAAVLEGKKAKPFRVPKGVKLIRVDRKTGLRVGRHRKGVIMEVFKEGEVPEMASQDGDGAIADSRSKSPRKGTGGLY